MSSNLPVIPIFIPLLCAAIVILFSKKIYMQRLITFIATLLTFIFSLINIYFVNKYNILVLEMGNWESPFGITLALDLLNGILVAVSMLVFLVTLFYAFKTLNKKRESGFFYPGYLLIMVGINGAFTTGDIFNLFVFYEILLMASYLLLLVGISKEQLKSSISYVLMNVFAGSLFVISIGYLYTIVGSLNMAYISQTISNLPDKRGVFLVGIVMIFVFCMKGALFPLFTWMNRSYAASPIPVMIIFAALLTKVGLYSIIRTYSLFYFESPAIKIFLLALGVISIIAGCIGAIYQRNLKQIIIFNVVISLGVMTCGVATLNNAGLKGVFYYVIHDILLKASLFIIISLVILICGVKFIKQSGLINKYPLLGWSFFIVTLCLAGVPPFSGFYGKALIIRGLIEDNHIAIAICVAVSGLIVFYSLIKIFLSIFYDNINKHLELKILSWTTILPAIVLISVAIIIGICSNYLDSYFDKGIQTVLNPQLYIDLVMKKGA